MDNKLKLNARCNWWSFVTSCWIGLSKFFTKLNEFIINQAKRSQEKTVDVIREMLKEDYNEDFKNELKEVIEMAEEL